MFNVYFYFVINFLFLFAIYENWIICLLNCAAICVKYMQLPQVKINLLQFIIYTKIQYHGMTLLSVFSIKVISTENKVK